MTNRKDMIDEAMLRPGRLELHVEIGLPNTDGRRQILNIHTKVMKENGKLENDIDYDFIAKETKNFTGAEIETLVKRAASYALNSGIDIKNPNAPLKFDQKISMKDFDNALLEIKPQFGTDHGSLDSKIQFGIYDYGESFNTMYKRLNNLIDQVKFSKNTNLLSVLLEGEMGTGKTALACDIAKRSEFPFVKVISPETLVGFTEAGKVGEISKVFDDAYKSPLSLIILDNIERIIEFIKIGPRFSNLVLQALLVYIKKIPPKKNRKLLVIGTTSMGNILNELEVVTSFNVKLTVPTLNSSSEVMNILDRYKGEKEEKKKISEDLSYIPIKQLLLIIDMTLQKGNDILTYDNFCDAYKFFLSK
jgi:vesicle-fusing ATPase